MNWVREVLRRYKLEEEFDQQQVILLWPKVAGRQLSRLTRVKEFRGGILTIEVSAPTVAQELSLLTDKYIARINELFGAPAVEKIRFVPGRFPVARPIKRVPLDPVYRAEAKEIFRDVPDPRLRGSFERLYLTLCQREDSLLAAGAKRCPRCGVVFFGDGKLCPGCRFDQFAEDKPKD